jgi:hypothetical protein
MGLKSTNQKASLFFLANKIYQWTRHKNNNTAVTHDCGKNEHFFDRVSRICLIG